MNINYNVQFLECFQGFIDSIYVFKKVFFVQFLYKQEDLVRDFLNIVYKVYNVKIFGKFVLYIMMNVNEFIIYRFF